MGTIHAAKYRNSARLQSVHRALLDGPKTSAELRQLTNGVAIHSDIAELRAGGVPVAPAEYVGRSEDNRKIYRYRLAI